MSGMRLFGVQEAVKKPEIRILLLSDFHVGSKYSVKPRGFGELNPVQKAILKKWEEIVEREGEVDYLYVGGDTVDGVQPSEKGKELWTADVDEQIDAAMRLVKMVKYRKLIVTYGTTYHTDVNLNADEVFAKRMNADKHGWEIHFKPEKSKSIFHMSHGVGVSTSAWQYRTTGIAKELVHALLNEKELYAYTGIIRSHAHYFVSVSFSKSFGIITPCWQTRTPYMIRRGLALIPKLGYVVLDSLDGSGDDGINSWMIRVHTFDIPRPELTVL